VSCSAKFEARELPSDGEPTKLSLWSRKKEEYQSRYVGRGDACFLVSRGFLRSKARFLTPTKI